MEEGVVGEDNESFWCIPNDVDVVDDDDDDDDDYYYYYEYDDNNNNNTDKSLKKDSIW